MLAEDFAEKAARDFADEDERELALALLEEYAERHEKRILRCILQVAAGDLGRLEEAETLAGKDLEGLIFMAERDPATGKQVRNLYKPFRDDEPPEVQAERETHKAAMKAFRKRLRLYRLDDESRIGGSPLSEGRASRITAIEPPTDFPQEVWDRLVEKGLLRVVEGAYELTEED